MTFCESTPLKGKLLSVRASLKWFHLVFGNKCQIFFKDHQVEKHNLTDTVKCQNVEEIQAGQYFLLICPEIQIPQNLRYCRINTLSYVPLLLAALNRDLIVRVWIHMEGSGSQKLPFILFAICQAESCIISAVRLHYIMATPGHDRSALHSWGKSTQWEINTWIMQFKGRGQNQALQLVCYMLLRICADGIIAL